MFSFRVIGIVTACCVSAVTSLTCLQCNEISHPRHCQVVAECKAGEVCFAESIVTADHVSAYRLGCVYENTATCGKTSDYACAECCKADLCNAGVCGETGYPQDRGSICYSCYSRLETEPCNRIAFCHPDEVCYVTERVVFGEKLSDRGCAHTNLCDEDPNQGNPGIIIGKRALPEDSTTDMCHACCNTDLCNHNCGTSSTSSTTTTKSTTTKSLASTTQSTPTSTQLTSTSTQSTSTSTQSTATTPQSTSTTTQSTTSATTAPTAPVYDCYDILTSNQSSGGDGFYNIYFNDGHSPTHTERVYCNMSAGGSTVFLYRFDGSVDFYRNFSEYENGFGQSHKGGEYWLGLQWLHFMTTHKRYELRIDVTFTNGTIGHWAYTTFRVGPPIQYTLTVGGFNHGFTYDIMAFHNGASFSTKDIGPDTRCAKRYVGGWWYKNCYTANLTGEYVTNFLTYNEIYGGMLANGATMSLRPF